MEFVLYLPYFVNDFKYETGFCRKKSYFMTAVSSRPNSVTSVSFKAIADNFSGLSRVWSFADTYLFFKESESSNDFEAVIYAHNYDLPA